MPASVRDDRRGASIALTHVLTMGITAILVSGLLVGMSGMVDDQRERAIRNSLETIGERLATETSYVEEMSPRSSGVTLRVEHPRMVAGRTYVVGLLTDPSQCDGAPPCLRLHTDSPGVTVVVPVPLDVPVADATVPGGDLRIVYDGQLTIEEGGTA
jgi:hypothetical protein